MKETSHCERKRLRAGDKEAALKKAIEAGEELTYKASLDKIRLSQAAFDTANVALARSYLEQVPPKLRRWEWYYLQKQFEGGIFALSGHADSVKRVCYSPDGTRIVTASGPVDMMSVRVWDARRGVSLFDLNGPLRGGSSVCFSPDGTRIATGSKEVNEGLGCENRNSYSRTPGQADRSDRLMLQSGWDKNCHCHGEHRGRQAHWEGLGRQDRLTSARARGPYKFCGKRLLQSGWDADRHGKLGQDGEGLGRQNRRHFCEISRTLPV